MRKVITSLMLLLGISFVALADVGDGYETISNSTSVISAYKSPPTGSSSEVSGSTYVNLSLFSGSSGILGIVEDGNVSIPEESRGLPYTAFRWEMTGNVFKQVSVAFSFGPMSLSSDTSKYIPYSVVLTCQNTTVMNGNSIVLANPSTDTTNSPRIACQVNNNTTRYFVYKDKFVTPTTGIATIQDISASSKSATISYNMSSNTKVYKNDTSTTPTNYNSNICSEWTRTGKAELTLKIENDGNSVKVKDDDTVLEDGEYVATVRITITAGT